MNNMNKNNNRRKQITRGRYNTKHFLGHTPAVAESDLNAAVEWSQQLRSVTSVWLGAAAAAFKSDSAPAGV